MALLCRAFHTWSNSPQERHSFHLLYQRHILNKQGVHKSRKGRHEFIHYKEKGIFNQFTQKQNVKKLQTCCCLWSQPIRNKLAPVCNGPVGMESLFGRKLVRHILEHVDTLNWSREFHASHSHPYLPTGPTLKQVNTGTKLKIHTDWRPRSQAQRKSKWLIDERKFKSFQQTSFAGFTVILNSPCTQLAFITNKSFFIPWTNSQLMT